MADSFSIDTSQVRSLTADLGKVAGRTVPAVRAVLEKAALNVKNDLKAQANASGIAEAKALARFIDYDMRGLSAEIGPRTGGPGSFAFLYFGNSKNGPALPDPGDALEREAPNLERFLLAAVEKSL